MLEQICSNPCGIALLKVKFGDHPSKMIQKDPNWGVGPSHGTHKPPSGKPSFSYEYDMYIHVYVYMNIHI